MANREQWRFTPKLISPVWLAAFVVTLANATGWDERTIRQMPLARAFQYYHAAIQLQGARTVATDEAIADEFERITEGLDVWQPTLEQESV